MKVRICSLLLIAVIVHCSFLTQCGADDSTHSYNEGEALNVYANKMGPFNNPLETYAYFEMPGCPPASWEHKFPSLGQALAGDELYRINADIKFRQDQTDVKVCTFRPTATDAAKWKSMVEQQYWYQLVADELPMWGTFGKMENDVAKVYTHQKFEFGYNGEHLVRATLKTEGLTDITEGREYEFMFSVKFQASDTSFENRFQRYLDESFFEHRIHWFSIFNSFMMVLFLVGLVLTILGRTLRADYARIARDKDDLELGRVEWSEESGWKQLHGDVFRVPPYPVLLCALVGTGFQLNCWCLSIVLMAIVSVVYTNSGGLLTYAVLAYAATSYIAGYFSASLFSQYSLIGPGISTQWIRCMALTACLFPGYILLSGFLLNFVAILYDSAQAIPFGGMVVMVLLWGLVAVPLLVMGTVVGRHQKTPSAGTPSTGRPSNEGVPHVNQIPRIVPPKPWYLRRCVFALLGSVLPFGSIFIELYFVFTSFWNYKLYYVYGFMLLVFLILVLVTGCVSIVCTYLLLDGEDHRWAWTSFSVGACTSIYIFLYATYFYIFKTKMTGLFMFVFYFSYMSMMCVGFAIICGTISFVAAKYFVSRIYRYVKAD